MNSGHIRLNRATREWVIYAPSRRKRPQELQYPVPPQSSPIPFSADCPFCPGNESSLEACLFELPDPVNGGWLTRVVKNKYPALCPENHTERSLSGMYLQIPGYGHHEIIIESQDHSQTLATLPLEAVEAVVETYRHRFRALMDIRENMLTIVFRNHGRSAGASLSHPHSQIIATPIVPRRRRWHEDEAQRYFDEWGRCAYCEILAFEREEGERIIGENDSFLAFVPFSAEVPFEIWIVPKRHDANFGSISDREVADFAHLLKDSLYKLYAKLNNPDYNYAIHTAARYKIDEPQLHWYCQIHPRLTTQAGFELGSGIHINPSIPEVDAAFLRS